LLVSKIQTYLSDKIHLKKVITKNMLNGGFFNNFLGAICHERKLVFFGLGSKFHKTKKVEFKNSQMGALL
jgi:hypothetical protein